MPMGSIIKTVTYYAKPFWRLLGLSGEAFDASGAPVSKEKLRFFLLFLKSVQGRLFGGRHQAGRISSRHHGLCQLSERTFLFFLFFSVLIGFVDNQALTPRAKCSFFLLKTERFISLLLLLLLLLF